MGRLVLIVVVAGLLAAPAAAAPRCQRTVSHALPACIAKATNALRRCTGRDGILCQRDPKATAAADRLATKVRKRCDASAIADADYPPPADPALFAAGLQQTCLGNAATLIARAFDTSSAPRCVDVMAAASAAHAAAYLRLIVDCTERNCPDNRRASRRAGRRLLALERRTARKIDKRCDDGLGSVIASATGWQMGCPIRAAFPEFGSCTPTSANALVDLWRLPVPRPAGTVAAQVSSYDRSGGNLDFGLGDDTAPFLAALGLPTTFRLDNSVLARDGERYVVFDEVGPGVVWRIWMTGLDALLGRGLAGDIAFHLDDEPAPRLTLTRAELFSGTTAPFLAPLAGNDDVSSGGFYAMTPIPFARRLRITTSHVPNWLHVSFARLPPTHAVASFDPGLDVSAVAAQLAQAGDPSTTVTPTRSTEVAVAVAPGATQPLWTDAGPGTIVRLELLAPAGAHVPLGLRLRGTFDGVTTIDAPLDEMFGASLGAGARSIAYGRDGDRYYCYFPMPFQSSASLEVENAGTTPVDGWTVRVGTVDAVPPGGPQHLHATARTASLDPDGRDFVLIDVPGRGHVVGVVLTSGCGVEGACQLPTLPGADGTHLEGDERITLDGGRWPQIHGTGLEDFFSGGFYYVRGAFTLPTHGNPAQAPVTSPRRPGRNLRSSYRVLLGDAIPFESRLRLAFEHGGENDVPAEMSSVVYWYGLPEPTLAESDRVVVGDPESESAHALSAEARQDYTLESRFRGDDSDVEVEAAGMTATVTRFELAVDLENIGVRLRRLTDLTAGGQRARVFVDGVFAGVWQTSEVNPLLRWAEVDLELPVSVTAGKQRLRIEIDATGSPAPWRAFAYSAHSHVR